MNNEENNDLMSINPQDNLQPSNNQTPTLNNNQELNNEVVIPSVPEEPTIPTSIPESPVASVAPEIPSVNSMPLDNSVASPTISESLNVSTEPEVPTTPVADTFVPPVMEEINTINSGEAPTNNVTPNMTNDIPVVTPGVDSLEQNSVEGIVPNTNSINNIQQPMAQATTTIPPVMGATTQNDNMNVNASNINQQVNMQPIPPMNNTMGNAMNNNPKKGGKIGIFIVLIVVVIVGLAAAYLLFGGKTLSCTSTEDISGIPMKADVKIKFANNQVKTVKYVITIDLGDTYKESKDEMITLLETNYEEIKQKGAKVNITSTDTTIIVTVEADKKNMSLLEITNSKSNTYSAIKKDLEEQKFTCK